MMKLGTKVKYTGYLKKVETKHVEFEYNKKEILKDAEIESAFSKGLGFTDNFEHPIFIEEECYQDIKTIVKKEFNGIIVAKKKIATARHFECVYNEHQNIACYNSAPISETSMQINNCNYTDCYQVFFRMGGGRLVPVEMCEVIE